MRVIFIEVEGKVDKCLLVSAIVVGDFDDLHWMAFMSLDLLTSNHRREIEFEQGRIKNGQVIFWSFLIVRELVKSSRGIN